MNSKFTKIVAVLSAMGIMLSFAACNGSKESETTTEAPSTSDTSTTAPSTEAPSVDPNASTAAPDPNASTEASTVAPNANPSTNAEILAVYKDVYKNSYKTVGKNVKEDLVVPEIAIDGKKNDLVTTLVKEVVKAVFKSGIKELPPLSWEEQGYVNNGESPLLESDIKTATYKDNGDGTATIKITPIDVKNSKRGLDAQGRAFNSLGVGVKDVVLNFKEKGLKWASGDDDSNVSLDYSGGYLEVTFDTATKVMKKGYWEMKVTVNVSHANYLVLKDKSLGATLTYKNSYN